ncbi:MAG TPA: tetratricopeptide repeat protein [Terracidiphilus sp.]|nr:tetratricopeptide repeat protein [Terracidiphilus sp.]
MAFGWVFAAFACSAFAQTYQVGPGGSTGSASQNSSPSQKKQAPSQNLGWGSNIQNARLGRAAESALEHGNHALAMDYAQRAVQAAPNDPQLWFLFGYAARLDGKYQQAVDAYSHGLRLDPSSLDGQSGLAQVYSLTGRTEEAERILKQVVASNPDRVGDLTMLGEMSMRSKEYAGAIDWLNRAEKVHPDARAELLLSLSYQHTNQTDLANRYLELAEHRSPNNPEIQRAMAGFYRDTGNFDKAIEVLQTIRNPKPDVTAELAYTYQLAGKPTESARFFARAANEEPKDMTLQLSAAQAEISAGSVAEANSFLKRASAIDGNYYRLHALNGEIAELQDRDRDALREYKAALANLPETPAEGRLYGIQLHMDLVALDRDLEDEADARSQLATAQAEISAVDGSGPDREEFLRLRSSIKLAAGDPNGALADVREALAMNHDVGNLQLDGDILMKLDRTNEAIGVYKQVLASNPDNRLALTSLGYALRAVGQEDEAEKYFEHLAKVDPSSHVAYLALGDLLTALRQFTKAQAAYSKGYELDPQNAPIVAGGINAGIEAHDLPVAGHWLARVTDSMKDDPKVLRETERYLRLTGKYQESEDVAEKAIKVLPDDREVVVYLGYDELLLKQDDDLLALTSKYWNILPKEADIPLLAGYVHKIRGLNEQAVADFTETIHRKPDAVTAYVNRGYTYNDLREPAPAASDFEAALKLEPNDGEAHLGLAYAYLALRKPDAALKQANLAERDSGDSLGLHVIRATAYGRMDMLTLAAREYKAALKFAPNDGELHIGLGNTYFAERRYHEAISELEVAKKFSPDNPQIYAWLARSYASLQDRERTYLNVRLAEQYALAKPVRVAARKPDQMEDSGSQLSEILISTGEALSTLGDQNGAMDRFQRALVAAGSDRISVRLAIAQIMTQRGHEDDAQRQIALGWMEAAAGDTVPPSGPQYVEAAGLFSSMHQYDLSEDYLGRAKAAGASDAEVRIALANDDLALGETVKAKAELAAISDPADEGQNYQYLLAEGNVYSQEHRNAQALTAFAQATNGAGDDQTAEQEMLITGANEGLRVNPHLSVLSDFSVEPLFENSTVYVLDSKTLATFAVPPTDTALLPPPRSSIQTLWTGAFHLHFPVVNAVAPGGFFQVRNARGLISLPATNSVLNRDTTDSTFNLSLNPTIHLGDNVVTFNTGAQETIRRDSKDPYDMDQNLFRVYSYMSTSSFFDAISVTGFAMREAGPFTQNGFYSRELAAKLDFRVGSPWGKTALLTGYGVDDLLFKSAYIEYYFTSSYAGIEHRFSPRLDIKALAEYVRSWRIYQSKWGISQSLRPAGSIDFIPKRNWNLQVSSAFSSVRGFHLYDATQNSISLSYSRPFHRTFNENSTPLSLQYPIRFSAGIQQETFFNFPGAQSSTFRPYAEITIF